jgi:hypothetical protein
VKTPRPTVEGPAGQDAERFTLYTRRHMRLGWWSLLLFLSLGLLLDALHGFKVSWYLGAAHETRRLMWTLAHAHGVLLALVNIAFALTQERLPGGFAAGRRLASACLIGATALLPGGFFLGGIVTYAGDPGLGGLLVPLGALLLFLSVALVARAVSARAPTPGARR